MGIARENAVISVTVGTTTLVGKEGYAFKFHTDGTAIPISSNTDAVAGIILQGAAVGEEATVLLNGAGGPTAYAKLGTSPGTVVRGTLIEIKADGSWKADAGTSGTVAAIALESGAAEELIEVALLGVSGTITLEQSWNTTCAGSADGAALTVSGQVQDAADNALAGRFIVGVFFGEGANDGIPHDFGDLAADTGSVLVKEHTADAYAEVLTAADGSWSVVLTVGSDDTVESNAFVIGKVTSDSTAVDVP